MGDTGQSWRLRASTWLRKRGDVTRSLTIGRVSGGMLGDPPHIFNQQNRSESCGLSIQSSFLWHSLLYSL